MLIEWRKDFETGIADVDHEHRELVDLINSLHEQTARGADRDAVSDFLGEVFARISAHFALEETVMRKFSYDQYQEHKGEHERLLDELRDIMDAWQAGEREDYEKAMSGVVRDWFIGHFKTHDARLHKLLGV